MKRILIPTDFSDQANYALKVAAQIARKNNAEIVLLHMLELPHQTGDAISSGHEIPEIMFFKNKAIERLENLMDADFLNGIEVSEVIQFEKAFNGIMEISKKNNIDLIVMGSHGINFHHDFLVGSNTKKVIRNADIPVLVIKNNFDAFKVEKFVFASDFSEESKEPFKKVLDIAKSFEAELHLVIVNTPSNFKPTSETESTFRHFIDGYESENIKTHVYNDLSVDKGILHFANSIQADLIGISTHGRGDFIHFFNGSISEDVVSQSVKPVITFKI